MSLVVGKDSALSFDDTWYDGEQGKKLWVNMYQGGASADTYINKAEAIKIVNLLVDMFDIKECE